jgi:hypothetical protein
MSAYVSIRQHIRQHIRQLLNSEAVYYTLEVGFAVYSPAATLNSCLPAAKLNSCLPAAKLNLLPLP